MKSLGYLFFSCLVLFACKKTGTPDPQDPQNPQDPTDTTNSGNGAIKVTGISPAHIYGGDTITITGSGFSTDPSKDTVTMGYIIDNKFTLVAITKGNDHNSLKVISASATQLKIATDSALYFDNVISYLGVAEPTMAVRIAVGSDHVQTDTIAHFRRWPFISEYTTKNPYPGNNPAGCAYVVTYTYTNDSLFLTGTGMYPPCKFYIDDHEVPMEFHSSLTPAHFDQQRAVGHLPIDFFGLVNPVKCEDTRMLNIKVVNADGRIAQGKLPFWPGPAYKIAEEKWDSTKYHLSYGHAAKLHFKGYCLRNDMYITLSGYDANNGASFSKEFHIDGVNNFPSEFTMPFDLSNLPVPSSSNGIHFTWNIKIGQDGTYYGFYADAFTLYN